MGLRVALETLSAEDWHEILLRFADARIEQSHIYAAVRAKKGRIRHLVVRDGEVPVAAAQIVERRLPLLGDRIAFVKYGPVWRRQESESGPGCLEAALRGLHERLVQKEGAMLRVMPSADPSSTDDCKDMLIALGFKRRPIDSPQRYLVDLALSDDELRASLKGKWRYNLKRAEARGLTFRTARGASAMQEFVTLHHGMRQRKNFAEPFDVEALPRLAELPPPLCPRVLLCELDGRPVAGAVISMAGDTAAYLLGAMDEQGARLDAGYVLHWRAVTWLKRRSCRWYDLGGDCNDAGLRQFKSGMVGKQGRMANLPGYFDAAGSARAALLGRLAFGLRELRAEINRRRSR